MKSKELPLHEALKNMSEGYANAKLDPDEFARFKTALAKLFEKVAAGAGEGEENQKNIVAEFLKDAYYKDKHDINTKDKFKIDLVIHAGKSSQTPVAVIIETKNPVNAAEMITAANLNAKALHQLVLYYFREKNSGNDEIAHLIATNISDWFIFDAAVFKSLFYENAELVAYFEKHTAKKLDDNSTSAFYAHVERFVDENVHKIAFTHFCLNDFKNVADEDVLIELYKILSPDHLLKLPFRNDSNTLNKAFYNELLYIIGLTETEKQGKKKLIERCKEGDRQSTILEEIIAQLKAKDKIGHVKNAEQYGSTNEEQLFGVALELAITWINRILFLKLLEAQLLSYHHGDEAYSFLSLNNITGYGDLDELFFQVLALKPNERSKDVQEKFSKVPYLNSTLFTPTELEQHTLSIGNLTNKLIHVFPQTVLKEPHKNKGKRTGMKTSLAYLFEFLNAYDFGSETKNKFQSSDRLINASVLGLIFEKINGYKDGSFYTPGFITMYMCREAIRKAVVQKFNDVKNWNCQTLIDIYNKIDDTKEANAIVNSLKVCDPAVGSGHFLVSALNEIIAIKHDLKILQDRSGKRLKEYGIKVVDDELQITEYGEPFVYLFTSEESQRVQETLFHEKQTIIENCLFGVDINPNSVAICRLRLWIELLKNMYYKNGTDELETLPNIDINIKCGNSLVSRFPLDADLEKVTKGKHTVEKYRNAVATYRNAKSRDEKQEMERLISEITSSFRGELSQYSNEAVALRKLKGKLIGLTEQKRMFEKSKKEQTAWEKEVRKVTAKIEIQEAENEAIKNSKIYANAFEWRFEFPEVLNEQGEFIGFDVIFANPPYIPLEAFSHSERKFFHDKYTQLERKYETSVPFILEGLHIAKPFGLLAYIAPITWQTGENYSKFRRYLLENFGIEKVINLPFNIFEVAYVDTALYFVAKEKNTEYLIYAFDKKTRIETFDNLNYHQFNVADIKAPDYKLFVDKSAKQFSRFDTDNFVQLGAITKSTQGLSGSNFPEAAEKKSEHVFPFLSKGNVYNYRLIKERVYNTDLSDKENLIQFYQAEPKILIRRIVSRQDRLSVTCCNEKLVFKKDINPFIPTDKKFDWLYLAGVLASKFISFIYINSSSIAMKDDFRQTTLTELRKLPIPNISSEQQAPIITLVNQILVAKTAAPNADTTALESEIDRLVYELYGLTDEEREIVEGKHA